MVSGGWRRSTTKHDSPSRRHQSPPRTCETFGAIRLKPDPTPADATPADATPADVTPADVTPADVTPGDVTPGDVGSGFSRIGPRITARNRSASIEGAMSGRERLSQKPIEDDKRCGLRQSAVPGISHRANASRTTVFAIARRDERPGAFEELVVHAVQGLAESDAAGIVVVHEDLRGKGVRPLFRLVGRNRDADVVTIAHQQQLRHLPHRIRQSDDAVTTIIGRIWQRAHDRWRNRQPIGRRVQLLLRQIQLAGADVLVRIELDLLEPYDAGD